MTEMTGNLVYELSDKTKLANCYRHYIITQYPTPNIQHPTPSYLILLTYKTLKGIVYNPDIFSSVLVPSCNTCCAYHMYDSCGPIARNG